MLLRICPTKEETLSQVQDFTDTTSFFAINTGLLLRSKPLYYFSFSLVFCLHPGLALTYILESCFKPEGGSRVGIPKIGILITDGKSQDDVIPPAESLRKAGVELFAIGKNDHRNNILYLLWL